MSNGLFTEFKVKRTRKLNKIMRRPGIEPGSTAWKATMLTFTPPTLHIIFTYDCFINLYIMTNPSNCMSFETAPRDIKGDFHLSVGKSLLESLHGREIHNMS